MERVGLGEADFNFVGGVFAVDLSHGVDLVLNLLSVEGIKVHSDVLLSIESHSGSSASNGGGVHLQPLKHYYMNTATGFIILLRYLARLPRGRW